MRDHVYAIILAGGSGTRFWPASRHARPKQLLSLAPGSDEALLRQAWHRLEGIVPPERRRIATGAHLVEATRALLPEAHDGTILGEPVARDTAAAIGWVTDQIRREDPDALVMVLPSDHGVRRVDAFREAVERATSSAAGGTITTLGIRPTRPDPGYGYIEQGDELEPGIHAGVRFVEKPDRATAQSYLDGGRHLWNAGMFFFRADVMMSAIERHQPSLAAGLEALRGLEGSALVEAFASLPSVSIDHGVMEEVASFHVVPAEIGWSDLGTWDAAWAEGTRDAAGNAVAGEALLIEARDNLVHVEGNDGPLVALVGVEGLCVVQTRDAILVVPRERAQEVRDVVKELGRRGRDDLT